MPRIPDKFLESIVYLYPSMDAAEKAQSFGGCGFFILVPFERAKRNHLYVVTNRHVIEGGSQTLRISSSDLGLIPIDTDERNWFFHPDGDDLAILLVDVPFSFNCIGISLEETVFVTKELIQQHDLGVGEEAFSIGRFVDHDGRQKHTPVVRFGNISQMPTEKVRQDNGYMQESYLVEGRSVGGYSGSPVFMFIPPWAVRPGASTVNSQQLGPWFLGVNWGHLTKWSPVCDAVGRPSSHGMQVAQNTGMMTVVPAWKLSEMLTHSQVLKTQRALEKRMLGADAPLALTDALTYRL